MITLKNNAFRNFISDEAVFLFLLSVFFFDYSLVQGTNEGYPAGTSRIVKSINEDWRFLNRGVYRGQWTMLDDSGWQAVNLPHTWNAEDCFDYRKGYRRGIGWYRRKIYLNEDISGRRMYLYFEGACQVADVFVNGGFIKSHMGGFSGFAVDITEHVQVGENVIAVKVDNSWNRNIAPLGEIGFVLFGGLYRDVWLITTNELHIDMSDEGSKGVYIDTPKTSKESANIRIRARIVNDSEVDKSGHLKNVIVDADGKVITSGLCQFTIAAGGTSELIEELIIDSPKLWSPDKPYLYNVYTEVYEDNNVVDIVENPLGVRWFYFDADKGFFLNGEHLKLKGTNRHQDRDGFGSALPDELHLEDMRLIKEMGANFVRLAHYQQDHAVLKACDRLGILVWEEIPVTFYVNTERQFIDNSKKMLSEMIKQHYNHPSIILWGYMNEPLLRDWRGEKGKKSDQYINSVTDMAKEFDAYVRELDPSRKTVLAINGTSYHKTGMSDIPDVLGWNRYTGWYGSHPSVFGQRMDAEHEAHPEHVIIVSEYGAGSDSRCHSLKPDRMDFTVEYAQMLHSTIVSQAMERDYIAGLAVWSQFDFCNPYSQDTMPGINQKGLMRGDRTPKDVYYLLKSSYSCQPVLHIASRQWNRRTGTNRQAVYGSGKSTVNQPVTVFSNLEKIELFANGISLDEKEVEDRFSSIWSVPFKDGTNVIEARGTDNGVEIKDRCDVEFVYRTPILSDPSITFKELAINVGSQVQFIDEIGIVWEADQKYSRGSWGHIGGKEKELGSRARKSYDVLKTQDDPLYQRFLKGIEAYRFDVPDGDYEVLIRTCDYDNKLPSARVFNIKANGVVIIKQVDLVKKVGALTAFDKSFEVNAKNGQGVNIEFEPIKGQTILCAIKIKKL